MNALVRRLLVWSPRVFCIAFAFFVSLFALDVFNKGLGLWKAILALSIHLIPTAFILLVLALSWRWGWIGGILFIAAGIVYLIGARHHPDWVALISGSLFLVGALFLLNWLKRADIRA
jgi:hypothetical protein